MYMCVCLCFEQNHKKVLDKYGKPEDALPGIKNHRESLPHTPLTGMYNKSGNKVRLTFKMEADQLWIGTKGKKMTDRLALTFMPGHSVDKIYFS